MPLRKQTGSILILSLWILAILAVFSLSIGVSVRQTIRRIQHFETRRQLRSVAETGVKKALFVLNQERDKLLEYDAINDSWSRNNKQFEAVNAGKGAYSIIRSERGDLTPSWKGRGKVVYGLTDEESKLNINQTTSIPILTRLFVVAAGIEEEEARTIAASILDWKDEDDNPYEGGAESFYYKGQRPAYVPKNANFGTLEELLLVKGITDEIYRRILPYVTLDSNDTININTAPKAVLNGLGFSESLSRKVVSYRKGPDGLEGTPDDMIFKELGAVVDNLNRVLALSEDERNSLESFIGSAGLAVNSENFSLSVIAWLNQDKNQQLWVSCTVNRQGTVIRWSEQFIRTDTGS